MRWFEQAAPLTGRSITAWAVDVVVAVVGALSVLPYLLHDGHHTPAFGVLIPVLFLVAAPLVVRRAFPVPVLIWLLVLLFATSAWNERVVPGLGLLIALYTIASSRPRKVALLAAALLVLVVIVEGVRVNGTQFWYDSIFLSGLVGAALGLGLYAGTRRAYLVELHDRAARLERERDQQGALAAAAERARITREMHDVVAHHLTVMVALSDGAIAASAASPERGIEAMRTVSATGRRALADTRRLLGVLRRDSATDTREDLKPVPDLAELDVLLDRVRSAGLPTSFEVHGFAPDVPTGVQSTVYRLVQEALTNTLKHGGSDTRASVQLRYLPGELRVDILDDGAGIDAATPVGVGGGLTGMHERVHAYGGDLRVGPGRPGGWRVSARLRLDDVDDLDDL